MFAAAHPDRASAVVMFGGSPRTMVADDYPFGVDEQRIESFATHLSTSWGSGLAMSIFAPGIVEDDDACAFWARYQQLSASPGAAAAFTRAIAALDVRDILAQVSAPTLVLHATRDAVIPVGAAKLMAQLLPDSTYVELDSDVHMIWLSDVVEQLTSEIMSFLAHTLAADTLERVLSTALCMTGTAITRDRTHVGTIVARHQGRQQHPAGTVTFDRPGQAVRCALELARELHAGAAIHTGECDLLANGDVIGIAVDIAHQLAEASTPGQVLVTHTIRDLLVSSDVEFEHHSRRCFDAVHGEWDIQKVTPR
jgi:hypothetical protein